MNKLPELLAPAGNFEKLETAILYGADAVYLGGKSFSLRAFSDNFDEEQMKKAIAYAHRKGKKVYVTANIFAKNADFGALSDYFSFLQSAGADAAIVTDAGVISLAKKVAPKLCLHLSTQANTTNAYAAKFWYEQGISRVVAAREMSVSELAKIKEVCPELEVEVFVHGAMCISYSGRCLLSNYLDARDSNRGECVQACRRKYFVRSAGKEECEAEEDGRGTYIFNSKDLNLLPYLQDLIGAGVDSFKIEGRMKSGYYLATVVNAYRRALSGEKGMEEELCKCAHRAYTTAFAFGENAHTVNYADSQTQGRRAYAANVLGSENGFVLAEMRNRFRIGDVFEILSPNEYFNKTFVAENIMDEAGNKVEDVKRVQQKVRISCPYPLSAGDILRLVPENEAH